MADEIKKDNSLIVATGDLEQEATKILNQIISEQDASKSRELAQKFNFNQNKKTMARLNKLNTLQDLITDQLIARYTEQPDTISNEDLLKGLKTVQDSLEKSNRQIMDTVNEQITPLIQINQQNNELNMDPASNLNRDSRERVKNAVMSALGSILGQGDINITTPNINKGDSNNGEKN